MKIVTCSILATALLAFAGLTRADGPATTTTKPASIVITIDTSEAPEMADFGAKAKAAGEAYYATIAKMLPSDGYTPADKVTIKFLPVTDPKRHYVAYTNAIGIFCDPDYYAKHQDDVGSIIHELVHVVQKYPNGRRANPAKDTPDTVVKEPGWLTEGIADWVRWFHYEPVKRQPHPKGDRAKYDGSYQTTAAFLDWTSKKYNKDLVEKLNVACREKKYHSGIWKELTGKTVEELGAEWKASTTQ
jgi:hypothetical protein